MKRQLKGIAYITEIVVDEWSYKIIRFLRRISDCFNEELRKEREIEQQRRHQEFEAYMQLYLKCVEEARAEDDA